MTKTKSWIKSLYLTSSNSKHTKHGNHAEIQNTAEEVIMYDQKSQLMLEKYGPKCI